MDDMPARPRWTISSGPSSPTNGYPGQPSLSIPGPWPRHPIAKRYPSGGHILQLPDTPGSLSDDKSDSEHVAVMRHAGPQDS